MDSTIASSNSYDSIFELIEWLLSFNDISAKVTKPTKKVDNLAEKAIVFLVLGCWFPKPLFLHKRIIDLEQSSLDNSLCLRWEMIEHFQFLWICKCWVRRLFYKALLLLGNKVYPDDLETCQTLKKRENVIVKFKGEKLKYKVIGMETIKNKSKELNELKFF